MNKHYQNHAFQLAIIHKPSPVSEDFFRQVHSLTKQSANTHTHAYKFQDQILQFNVVDCFLEGASLLLKDTELAVLLCDPNDSATYTSVVNQAQALSDGGLPKNCIFVVEIKGNEDKIEGRSQQQRSDLEKILHHPIIACGGDSSKMATDVLNLLSQRVVNDNILQGKKFEYLNRERVPSQRNRISLSNINKPQVDHRFEDESYTQFFENFLLYSQRVGSRNIPEATFIFGFTGTGKTTLSAYLAGAKMKATKKNNIWAVEISDQEVKKKIVIGHTRHSQTAIPNVIPFTLKSDGSKQCIVDNTGFGDTFGIAQEIINFYYTSTVFDKLQKGRFLINVSEAAMKDKGETLAKSLNHFVELFNADRDNFDKICKHSAGIIVSRTHRDEEMITNVLQRQLKEGDFKPDVKFFIEQCIERQAIYTFYKPEQLFILLKKEEAITDFEFEDNDKIFKQIRDKMQFSDFTDNKLKIKFPEKVVANEQKAFIQSLSDLFKKFALGIEANMGAILDELLDFEVINGQKPFSALDSLKQFYLDNQKHMDAFVSYSKIFEQKKRPKMPSALEFVKLALNFDYQDDEVQKFHVLPILKHLEEKHPKAEFEDEDGPVELVCNYGQLFKAMRLMYETTMQFFKFFESFEIVPQVYQIQTERALDFFETAIRKLIKSEDHDFSEVQQLFKETNEKNLNVQISEQYINFMTEYKKLRQDSNTNLQLQYRKICTEGIKSLNLAFPKDQMEILKTLCELGLEVGQVPLATIFCLMGNSQSSTDQKFVDMVLKNLVKYLKAYAKENQYSEFDNSDDEEVKERTNGYETIGKVFFELAKLKKAQSSRNKLISQLNQQEEFLNKAILFAQKVNPTLAKSFEKLHYFNSISNRAIQMDGSLFMKISKLLYSPKKIYQIKALEIGISELNQGILYEPKKEMDLKFGVPLAMFPHQKYLLKGDELSLFTGLTSENCYYQDGMLLTGYTENMIFCEDGVPLNGLSRDGYFFKHGHKFSGTDEDGILYKEGQKFSGIDEDETVYCDGKKSHDFKQNGWERLDSVDSNLYLETRSNSSVQQSLISIVEETKNSHESERKITSRKASTSVSILNRSDVVISNNFDGASIPNADLSAGNLAHSSFVKADLRECDFSQSDISQCDFTDANLKNAKFVGQLSKKAMIKCMCLNEEGNLLFTATFAGQVTIYNLDSQRLIVDFGSQIATNNIRPVKKEGSSDIYFAFQEGNKIIINSYSEEKKQITSTSRVDTKMASIQTYDVAYVALKNKTTPIAAVAQGGEKNIKVFNIEGSKEIAKIAAHQAAVNKVVFAPKSKYIFSAGADKTIKIHKPTDSSWKSYQSSTVCGLISDILNFEITADEANLIISSADSQIKVWLLKENQPYRQIKTDLTGNFGFAYLPGLSTIHVAVFEKDQVEIWDLVRQEKVRSASLECGAVSRIIASNDGNRILALNLDELKNIHVFERNEFRDWSSDKAFKVQKVNGSKFNAEVVKNNMYLNSQRESLVIV